jgi:hypothetical protein
VSDHRVIDLDGLDVRETLARALFLAEHPDAAGAWDVPGEGGRVKWRGYADAVLAVLRETGELAQEGTPHGWPLRRYVTEWREGS